MNKLEQIKNKLEDLKSKERSVRSELGNDLSVSQDTLDFASEFLIRQVGGNEVDRDSTGSKGLPPYVEVETEAEVDEFNQGSMEWRAEFLQEKAEELTKELGVRSFLKLEFFDAGQLKARYRAIFRPDQQV